MISFSILDQTISLISDETCYGLNTVAQVNEQFFYLGKEQPNVGAAILAWEMFYQRDMTDKEFKQVLTDNNILSIR